MKTKSIGIGNEEHHFLFQLQLFQLLQKKQKKKTLNILKFIKLYIVFVSLSCLQHVIFCVSDGRVR